MGAVENFPREVTGGLKRDSFDLFREETRAIVLISTRRGFLLGLGS